MRLSAVLFILSVAMGAPVLAQSLLLTGEVASAQAQSLTVPRAGRAWRYQIQWMAPEGSMVRAGDTVVVFDKSSASTELDQLEGRLIQVEASRQAKRVEVQLSILQARFSLKERSLQLEKAQLDASVPPDFQSPKEYADKQFELLKAQSELEKAEQALEQARISAQREQAKLDLDKARVEMELESARQLMAGLELIAAHDGPMIYARRPWDGVKTEIGDTVQVGTQVASIPRFDALQVRAWANEVDIDGIRPGMSVSLTLDADPAASLTGLVTAVALNGERRHGWGESTWFQVAIDLNQGEATSLTPGMSVRVSLEGQG
ncbi:HlyD family efflux transporter periplasmic adaptor subunit [Ferrimonas sediminicola]|uniref:HlyD family efflux transporter periplasmic adaptor subunit n=1 Tax=Ferrimonas sediminicola TaxID=2569538 RepID=A0A4U1B9T5_9GAMM|nr:HlyD family efflux transporter periplasmic adaptor subunit [Ferrimonas sediminicola]TKB47316.1 HlyD family efflux transporter periplasmic adaptor subunit [Ferrimonas sediminicola]